MDMTRGRPLPLMASFAVPLMAGNVCQLLYSVADSAVVGRVLGVQAFAAVGAASFYSWLVMDIVLGFSQGFGVVLAQRFGGKDSSALRRTAAMLVLLGLLLALVLTGASRALIGPVLRLTGIPEDIRLQSHTYLWWLLAGVPAMVAYNLAASMLRALGNSRAPLTAVIVSCVSNVGLNLLFSAVFGWGVAGVALATAAAQTMSFLCCLVVLCRVPELRLCRRDFRIDTAAIRQLLRLGVPPALRNAVTSLGGLFVQRQINRYGTLFVAGVTASYKYFDLMNIVSGGLEGAVATFSAQNYGAGDLGRVRSGVRTSAAVGLASSVVTGLVIILLRRWLIGLLVTGSAADMAAILESGSQSLLAMALFLPALYLLFVYRAGIQGMGNAWIPTLSGFTELAVRVAAVLTLPAVIGVWGVHLAMPLGWAAAWVLLNLSYCAVYRSRCRQMQ